MRRFFLVFALGMIGISGLLAGCGDSSEAEEPSITKKQFVKRAENFCINDSPHEEEDMRRYAAKHLLIAGGGEPWEQEILSRVLLEHVEDKIEFFESLPVPEGDGKEVRGMIEAFEEGVEKTRRDPSGLAEPRIGSNKETPHYWDASYETTADYGPMICGQP